LLIISRLKCHLRLKTFESFKHKIPSTSLVYAHYMLRQTLVLLFCVRCVLVLLMVYMYMYSPRPNRPNG
jgi:hypothetical protein